MAHIPWFISFIVSFIDPGGALKTLAEHMVSERTKAGSNVKDLLYYLVHTKTQLLGFLLTYQIQNPEEEVPTKASMARLVDEGFVSIIAGYVLIARSSSEPKPNHSSLTRSDTTSTALASLWYYLLQNPGCYARLREEVHAVFPSGEEPTEQQKLSAMPYLNACLYATFIVFSPPRSD
jgi:hypothetical protein